VEIAGCLDRALGADGELAGMVIAAPQPGAEQAERMRHVMSRRARVDAVTVEALAGVLAAHRRLDDQLESAMLLPAAEAQWQAVNELAQYARGQVAGPLRRVAAEWTQFVGWLNAEARRDATAVRWLTEAADQADEIGDGQLAAQAADFRGYLDRQRGNPRGVVRHCLTAFHTPGADLLQRACNAVHASYGYGRLGDRAESIRLLAVASDLTEAAEGRPAPGTAYWLSPSFMRLGIGLAHLTLDERAAAADHLRVGLESLPSGHAEAEWAGEYRAALALAIG
jgi:hypothetical protein